MLQTFTAPHARGRQVVVGALAGPLLCACLGAACKGDGADAGIGATDPMLATSNGSTLALQRKPDGSAPAEARLQKSEELHFLEATAELVCLERTKKRPPKAKERDQVLARHGFAGKPGQDAYNALSIRGTRDVSWAERMKERLESELLASCR